jgi:hypothetical protein
MKQKTLQSTYTTRRKIFSRNGEQTERNGSKAGATFHLTNLEANWVASNRKWSTSSDQTSYCPFFAASRRAHTWAFWWILSYSILPCCWPAGEEGATSGQREREDEDWRERREGGQWRAMGTRGPKTSDQSRRGTGIAEIMSHVFFKYPRSWTSIFILYTS